MIDPGFRGHPIKQSGGSTGPGDAECGDGVGETSGGLGKKAAGAGGEKRSAKAVARTGRVDDRYRKARNKYAIEETAVGTPFDDSRAGVGAGDELSFGGVGEE